MPALSSLPCEIRVQIYEYLFPSHEVLQCIKCSSPTYTKSVLQLNQSLRHESLPSLYSNRVFHLLNPYSLAEWTRSLDLLAKKLITYLCISMPVPPKIGLLCDWIRPIELGIPELSGLKELQLQIALWRHEDAARLGVEFTKLVRPVLPLTARLIIDMMRCWHCRGLQGDRLCEGGASDGEVNSTGPGTGKGKARHHLWTWMFAPGARAPIIRRRLPLDDDNNGTSKSPRSLLRDRLFSCSQAVSHSRSPEQTRKILAQYKASVVLPILTEPLQCRACQEPLPGQVTLEDLLAQQCEECGMDLRFFCEYGCDWGGEVEVWGQAGRGNIEDREMGWAWRHGDICVPRGWTKAEKEGMKRIVEALKGLDEGEDEGAVDEHLELDEPMGRLGESIGQMKL